MSNERILGDDDALDNPQISVVLLAGLPASGKSTLARKLKRRFNEDDEAMGDPRTEKKAADGRAIPRLLHIEYDDLEDSLLSSLDMERDDVDGNTNEIENRRRNAWNLARHRAVEQMEEAIRVFRARGASRTSPSPLVTNDTVILMDDNFHLRGMRKQIHRLLLNYRPIRFGILQLGTSLDICLERNRERSGRRKIPSEVIEKMSTSFEPPRMAWEVSSTKTILDSNFSENDCERFEEIVKFIQDCPDIVDLPCDSTDELGLEQQASDRAKTRQNEVHTLDKLLRSYVGRVAKFDKSLAKKANLGRKSVMEEFKAGRIDTTSIIDVFLDLLVPINFSSTNQKDSDMSFKIRSSLRDILEP